MSMLCPSSTWFTGLSLDESVFLFKQKLKKPGKLRRIFIGNMKIQVFPMKIQTILRFCHGLHLILAYIYDNMFPIFWVWSVVSCENWPIFPKCHHLMAQNFFLLEGSWNPHSIRQGPPVQEERLAALLALDHGALGEQALLTKKDGCIPLTFLFSMEFWNFGMTFPEHHQIGCCLFVLGHFLVEVVFPSAPEIRSSLDHPWHPGPNCQGPMV